MSPLDLIYLAAASLRAGKAGKSVPAWCAAIDEARRGYFIVLENAPGILAEIDAGLERLAAQSNGKPPQSGEVPESPPSDTPFGDDVSREVSRVAEVT